MAKLKLGILASGNGTNLQAILDAISAGELDAEVRLVITNMADAFAAERARRAGVETRVLPHRSYTSREAFDAALIAALEESGAEWIVLAGFMRLLTPEFIRRFSNRILNIHPALLPSFPGTRAIEQAFAHGVRITGCTVHLVDEGVDSGPILAQAAVEVLPSDTLETLTQRMHVAEHRLYVRTLIDLSTQGITVTQVPGGGRPRIILGPC